MTGGRKIRPLLMEKKMPFLTIKTNGFCNDNKLAEKAAALAAEVLGKPLKVVAVDLMYNAQMAFDGSQQKTGVWIELASIGFKDRVLVVAALTEFAIENFKAERDLVCVRLIDLSANEVAHGGRLLG